MKKSLPWDGLGITTSLLCAVHCVVLPLFISSLPVWGLPLLHNEVLELGMLALSLLFGVLALAKGCLVHKRMTPLLLFCAGFCGLVVNQWNDAYALALIPAAALIITSAHVLNFRYTRLKTAF